MPHKKGPERFFGFGAEIIQLAVSVQVIAVLAAIKLYAFLELFGDLWITH